MSVSPNIRAPSRRRLAPTLDGVEGLRRVLASRLGQRQRLAALLALEGLGYRRAAWSAGQRDHADLYRAMRRLGLHALHELRRQERRAAAHLEMLERVRAELEQPDLPHARLLELLKRAD